MVADAGGESSPQNLPQDQPRKRRPGNTSLWAALAIIVVVAIIVLMLLTQCTILHFGGRSSIGTAEMIPTMEKMMVRRAILP